MADNSSSSDARLDAIVAEYYEARDAGRPLTADELAARYPDLAVQIRQFIGDVENVAAVLQHRPRAADLAETVAASGEQTAALRAGAIVRYFGDYEVLGELGRGGMGVVYQARQRKLKRVVALKMIMVGQLATDSQMQRFQAEARAAARLTHPGIVSVHEVGTHDGQHFYTMDFVAGGSLAGLHRDEPVPARRAAELVKQLAEAVHYAHEQGVVHRDLKPANVLLTSNGAPRITDFGLAKRLWTDDDSQQQSITESGQIIGTAGYMSPEQAAGKTRLVGPPADIYSLGAILYALLTSRAPFVGESQADTILQVIHKEPVSPRTLNPSTPRDLETICIKCLEKEPHKRYGTAQLLADDLTRFLENRPVLARPISRVARAWRWCRRNPWAATALALVLLVAIVSPPVAWKQYRLTQFIGSQVVTIKTQYTDIQGLLGKVQQELTAKEAALNRATIAEGIATAERKTAQQERDTAANRLYASDMQLGDRARREGNLLQMQARLERHQPTGGIDRRGWDWYFLRSQAFSERQLLSFAGHEREIDSVAWHPGGERVASADEYGSIQVWEAASARVVSKFEPLSGSSGRRAFHLSFNHAGDLLLGVPLATVPTRASAARSMFVWNVESGTALISLPGSGGSWSSDGKRLLLIGGEGAAMIWSVGDPAPKAVPGLTEPVVALAWGPRDDLAAFSERSGIVRLVKLADGEIVATLRGHAEPPTLLAVEPDGGQIATAGPDKTIRMWNVATGTEIRALAGNAAAASRLEWGPDGKFIAAAEGSPYVPTAADAVRVWDGATGDPLWQQMASNFAWSPTGDRLAALLPDATVGVWETGQWSRSETFIGHVSRPAVLDWSSDGQRLASAGSDLSVKVWDATPRMPRPEIPGKGIIAWQPSGEKIAVLTPDGLAVRIYDWQTARLLATLPAAARRIHSLAWNPAGTKLAAGTYGTFAAGRVGGGQLLVFDAEKETLEKNLGSPDDADFSRVQWTPDGRHVLVWQRIRREVRKYEVDTGAVAKAWPTDRGNGNACAWTSDGLRFAHDAFDSAGRARDVVVRDTDSGQIVHRCSARFSQVRAAHFDPDRNRLAVTSSEGMGARIASLQVFDLGTGSVLSELVLDDPSAGAPAFHPDGNRLAVGNQKFVTLWDLTTAQELLRFEAAGYHTAWRPGGKVLACGGAENVVFWDATVGYDHQAPLAEDYFRSIPFSSVGGFF
jgi:WD40 repeat protein/tRNA A-37 threonylcarbamoyl transferase component Bud32